MHEDGGIGRQLYNLVRQLFPINRSITGEGLRQTLSILGDVIPLKIHEVPSGTKALDWEIPLEWNVRAARIESMSGETLVDFEASNLHLVGYSSPVDGIFSRADLQRHVHTLECKPSVIPYRTGYYANTWGFCISHAQWEQMTDKAYRVIIDSDLKVGSMTYAEISLPGSTSDEVLISAHCCHPSLANDNLSGVAIAALTAKRLLGMPRRLSYRILFAPGTIGAIAWLAENEGHVKQIRHGLILSCLGDPGSFTYKKSRRGDAIIDRVVAQVFREREESSNILGFTPFGYDERQYCSPAFNMPVGCLMRSPNGSFPQYHTSADDLSFVTADALAEAYSVVQSILDIIDEERVLVRVDGRGEPQLGRRGLYGLIGGKDEQARAGLMWVLNLSDGEHSLIDMAERSGLNISEIAASARIAEGAGLVTARRE